MGDTYTMETIRSQNSYNRNLSESTNPYYFSGPFSGILAAPAAHHFIINFMSNHSADQPSGYLDKANLKTFYGISGPDDALVWNAGQEQIPQNWYRRPSSNPYDLKSALADIAINAAEYPGTIQIGGNTGTVNSYVGVDLANLTGGTYNADTLLEGNNLGCFAFQVRFSEYLFLILQIKEVETMFKKCIRSAARYVLAESRIILYFLSSNYSKYTQLPF